MVSSGGSQQRARNRRIPDSQEFMSSNENKVRIREFLARYLRHSQLQDGDDIFALGMVNSLFAMQLVAFIERELDTNIDNDDLEMANFKSIDAICAFVERKASANDVTRG